MTFAQGFRDTVSMTRNLLPFTAYPYRGDVVPCPVCGEVSSTRVANIDRRLKRLPTVACDGCGLLYTNPMPDEADLEAYYRRLYRLDYQMVVSPTDRHIRKRSAQASRRADIVARMLPRDARTLDFGAGSGEFVLTMSQRGFDAYGFEPGEGYASHARSLLGDRILHMRWQDISFERRFDLVTSFHVLEHLRDPVAALTAAARWVRPGGLIYVEVPDAVAQLRRKGFGSLHFAHLIGFNQHNLQHAAARAGLAVMHVVGPTQILFRRTREVAIADPSAGMALTHAALRERGPTDAYLSHHIGKVLRAFQFRRLSPRGPECRP